MKISLWLTSFLLLARTPAFSAGTLVKGGPAFAQLGALAPRLERVAPVEPRPVLAAGAADSSEKAKEPILLKSGLYVPNDARKCAARVTQNPNTHVLTLVLTRNPAWDASSTCSAEGKSFTARCAVDEDGETRCSDDSTLFVLLGDAGFRVGPLVYMLEAQQTAKPGA